MKVIFLITKQNSNQQFSIFSKLSVNHMIKIMFAFQETLHQEVKIRWDKTFKE